MVSIEPGRIRVARAVRYSEPDGVERTIPGGDYEIIPVEMEGLMSHEVELESWIIRGSAADGARDHVVDCETVRLWVEDGRMELL